MSPTTSYDWAGSSRVQDEARFDPKNPVYEYSSGSEAMAPLANVDSTLWDICHAALKQVFWTLPISPTANQISYDGPDYDGDPDTLEAYVEGLVSQAALLSPLFRHYIPKHAPSESLVCDSIPDPPYAPDGTVAYADYTYSGIAGQTFTILQGATLPTFPTHDYRKFALGTARCPCGWPITGNGLCQAPAGAACAAVKAALGQTGCAFSPANYSIVAASIDSAVATNTNCPEFEIGPHFGFLDPAANEQWLTGTTQLTANTTDLLIHGRAGFRAGSLRQLQSTSKSQINPAARNATIDSARLTTCDTSSKLPTIDIIDGFVDELFPMSQVLFLKRRAQATPDVARNTGRRGGGRRRLLPPVRHRGRPLQGPPARLTPGLRDLRPVPDRRGVAQAMRGAGKTRFNSRFKPGSNPGFQVQLLHLCVNLDVYRAPDPTVKKFKRTCPYFPPSYLPGFYTTPECLVFAHDAVYDPCRCMACNASAPLVLDPVYLAATPACGLRFDPRTVLNDAPIGYWPASDPDAATLNAFAADPALLLSTSFEGLILNDTDAAGNMLYSIDSSWFDAEGYMNETAQVHTFYTSRRCHRFHRLEFPHQSALLRA